MDVTVTESLAVSATYGVRLRCKLPVIYPGLRLPNTARIREGVASRANTAERGTP